MRAYRSLTGPGLVLLTILLSISGSSSWAAIAGEVRDSNLQPAMSDSLTVPLFKSRVLRLTAAAARISVGNPDVADILIVRATQLYVLGKDLGTTNVHLWDRNDDLIGTVAVEVTHDIESLKYKLHQLLPNERIDVFAVQRSIALRGQVSSLAAMNAALTMADAYLAQIQTSKEASEFEQESRSNREDASVGSVINLLEVVGGQQVMLEVTVAEIARLELKRLHARYNLLALGDNNWDFGGVNGGGAFPDAIFSGGERLALPNTGPNNIVAADEFAPNPLSIENQGFFGSFLSSSTLFNFALDAAKENGLAKILAEPTLTTLAGQEAEFLSGGEFPIPVPRGQNGVTVEFKEFGVGLKFLPLVLEEDLINVTLNISVSELSTSNTIGIQSDEVTSAFVIPSLTKRSANATVELREGQTIAIAGLINENLREVVTSFPGLGQIPILGALFRSQEFISNESELLILVTPRLAKPVAPGDIRLPTDEFVEPSDVDFYLMGRLEGRRKPSDTPPESTGGIESNYGHQSE